LPSWIAASVTIADKLAIFMANPFLSQILIWPPNFAPRGWAFCAGQILPISQNAALFSLIGTIYGGDGRTTFALPNLQGRMPIGAGQGSGLSFYDLGTVGGFESVQLNANTLPSHTHSASPNLTVQVPAVAGNGTTNAPSPSVFPAAPTDAARNPVNIYSNQATTTTLGSPTVSGSVTIGATGSGQPHENRQPFLAVNFIIALQGIFPSRN
jgi:microcystin-dependent protein